MEDYFENIDLLPSEVKVIVEEFIEVFAETSSHIYKLNEKYLNKLEVLGYTFEYGLDGDPYNLRPMVKGDTVRIKAGHELSDTYEEVNFEVIGVGKIGGVLHATIAKDDKVISIPTEFVRVLHV